MSAVIPDRPGGLNNNLFLTVLEDGIFEMRCWAGWFLLRLLSLAFRWLPSSWDSHKLFLYMDLCSSLLFVKGHQSCWIGATLMTVF